MTNVTMPVRQRKRCHARHVAHSRAKLSFGLAGNSHWAEYGYSVNKTHKRIRSEFAIIERKELIYNKSLKAYESTKLALINIKA